MGLQKVGLQEIFQLDSATSRWIVEGQIHF